MRDGSIAFARALLGVLASLLFGCGEPGGAAPAPALSPRPAGEAPRFNEVWQVGTHNAYWVDRGVAGDAFASGVGERLLDQLLVDHARSVEIDIHKDPDAPGEFRVYHTTPGNSLCGSLRECLGVLRAFHRAAPEHGPVTVVLELKEVNGPTFDADHTAADLDAILLHELGERLYRPQDFLEPCAPSGVTSLSACAAGAKWPSLDALRGRFLVALLGNWDIIGAQATKDWADYATAVDIRQRSAFPMASSWKLDINDIPPQVQVLLTQGALDAALEQSIFLQVEDAAEARAAPFLARNGVIRIDNAFDVDAQAAVVAAGMQMIQTDAPWVRYADEGPTRPFTALASAAYPPGVEPGARLALNAGPQGERVFAFSSEPATSTTTWEATIATGSDASGVGCLRAASGVGPSPAASITVCRRKISGRAGPDLGGGMGTPDAERALIDFEACEAGVCEVATYASEDGSPQGPGDLLSMTIESHAGAPSCATARAARIVDASLEPLWTDLGPPLCVGVPLLTQGIARPAAPGADGLVYFWATTRRASDGERAMRASSFSGVALEPEQAPAVINPQLLVDLSWP